MDVVTILNPLPSVDERVQQGVKALDQVKPGWEWMINLDTFKIESINHCVLAQLFGGYGYGILKMSYAFGGILSFNARAHGFIWQAGNPNDEHLQLQTAWLAAIEGRREA